VLRECAEETGLSVAHPIGGPLLVHVDVHQAADDHVHLNPRYLLLAFDAEPAPSPGESQKVAWFTWEEAATLADTALSGALRSTRRVVHAREAGGDREDM
jgi:8-oxo-dGTP pyrophosphatase MutT (NUDIX family)